MACLLYTSCTDGKTHDHIRAVKIFCIPWKYAWIDLQPFFRNTCKNIFQDIIDFLAFLSAVKVFLHLRICLFPEHATVAFPLLIDPVSYTHLESHKANITTTTIPYLSRLCSCIFFTAPLSPRSSAIFSDHAIWTAMPMAHKIPVRRPIL